MLLSSLNESIVTITGELKYIYSLCARVRTSYAMLMSFPVYTYRMLWIGYSCICHKLMERIRFFVLLQVNAQAFVNILFTLSGFET